MTSNIYYRSPFCLYVYATIKNGQENYTVDGLACLAFKWRSFIADIFIPPHFFLLPFVVEHLNSQMTAIAKKQK